jgi:hypothetical protein
MSWRTSSPSQLGQSWSGVFVHGFKSTRTDGRISRRKFPFQDGSVFPFGFSDAIFAFVLGNRFTPLMWAATTLH